MTAQEKALQLYNDAYERWANELSHDKNKLIAKSIATYVCDEILDFMLIRLKWDEKYNGNIIYWQEVRQELLKL